MIPWLGHTVVGTTDTPIAKSVIEPTATHEEIEFLLKTSGDYLSKKPTRGDILSVFVGVRPLVKAKSQGSNTSKLSRDHTILIDRSGLVTITGGKWTTARKMAEERNIDLSGVRGSGPEGRIVRRDIEQAQGSPRQLSVMHGGAATAAVSQQLQQPTQHAARMEGGPLTGSLTPMSKMREVIARRMQESVTQSPHFYVTTSIEMSAAKGLYAALKERAEFKGISLNHLVIKAVAYGIANEPRVNRTVRDGQIFTPDSINIGIITAIDDGLLIPVVKDADTLPLKDLVFEARAAVERARAGRPSAADLTGGTFSVSNMGMYEVENFTAIINPGQGSVLAVSSALEQPCVKNGQLTVGLMMKATISVDHRIIDGLMAATFLKHFKAALETPALLLL
ncbi:MAG: hypothetical protein EBZ48_03445 [Proteobacteria bacterium]|nr:hypothetical protein [Pseudomonadota bacterium]